MKNLDTMRFEYNSVRFVDVHNEVLKRIGRVQNSIAELKKDVADVHRKESRLMMRYEAQRIINELDMIDVCKDDMKHFSDDTTEMLSKTLKLKSGAIMASKNSGH